MACTVTCGGGTYRRQRACDNPAKANGGADCVGDATEDLPCNEQCCKGKNESRPSFEKSLKS